MPCTQMDNVRLSTEAHIVVMLAGGAIGKTETIGRLEQLLGVPRWGAVVNSCLLICTDGLLALKSCDNLENSGYFEISRN